MKYRRSWGTEGLRAFLKAMIARVDGFHLAVRHQERTSSPAPEASPVGKTKRSIVEKAKKQVRRLVPEVTRQNVPYLQQSSGTMVYQVLSELRGW